MDIIYLQFNQVLMKNNDVERLKTIFTERFNKLYEEKQRTRDEYGRKYTQMRIAKDLGISDTTIRKYCEGAGMPGFENILSIMQYFEVDFDWLIGREEHRSTNAEEAEKFGLSPRAAMNLMRVRNGENIADLGGRDIESFNPIVSGETDNKITYIADSLADPKPHRVFDGHEEDYNTHLVDLESETLNSIIEDWDIVRTINSYLHSTPPELASLNGFNYFEMDVFQLNLLINQLKKNKSNLYRAELANTDGYAIRPSKDGLHAQKSDGYDGRE